ncbi:MAG TPA: peptide-methionine (S)-S-oxide reductase [Saprospirales bacterium]|nr:peptide-methionine (S)-S-oxide reductase [Saprospirales bacterium]
MKLSILFALVASMGIACGAGQPEKSISVSNMQSVTQEAPAPSGKTEIATLGGGCFWCVEAIYQDLKGVLKVESGYSGGHIDNPTYKEVCSGLTGHAEVIQVTFDPAIISYADILHIFFTVHDPTTLNRQGNDSGTQYRSVIYYHSEEQRKTAEAVKIEAKEAWDDPIVTEISAFEKFYKAEDYHQNYFKDNPNQGYCSFIIAPKVKKFREKYKDRLKQ